jgi:hypothetical protein
VKICQAEAIGTKSDETFAVKIKSFIKPIILLELWL